eukprot:TRINITY_DN111392_c0_g1_i1.p1 TRINITY_DN111392_c0_g1~~TRINITY_DN111392_c0_g1_i1.p1  ORF type:complete len:165 (+),score=28.78 TRINITY_DN111392_c0_g1_i1:93-587(+)
MDFQAGPSISASSQLPKLNMPPLTHSKLPKLSLPASDCSGTACDVEVQAFPDSNGRHSSDRGGEMRTVPLSARSRIATAGKVSEMVCAMQRKSSGRVKPAGKVAAQTALLESWYEQREPKEEGSTSSLPSSPMPSPLRRRRKSWGGFETDEHLDSGSYESTAAT